MKIWTSTLASLFLVFSTSSHAVIINTLNGINYEWLELSATQGLSRNQVESMLSDPDSNLYGYYYPSRSLLSDLFLSYASFDGLSGGHSDPDVVSGIDALIKDFGITEYNPGDGIDQVVTTRDGGTVLWDSSLTQRGIYGQRGECIDGDSDAHTCVSLVTAFYDTNNTATIGYQDQQAGWDPLSQPAPWFYDSADDRVASYLVRTTVSTVPLPASVWLFGSGLIGLFG